MWVFLRVEVHSLARVYDFKQIQVDFFDGAGDTVALRKLMSADKHKGVPPPGASKEPRSQRSSCAS